MGESEHGDERRGASPPANPYPFVVEHHAGWANRSTGTDGVVPHRPQTLVSDVLPVNRTMKKYKICVTIILNFLLVIF